MPSNRGAIAIMSGTAAGQAITLIAMPMLSRLYDPNAFGTYTILLALATPLTTIATLRFELAIPLPKRDVQAYGLVWLGMISAFTMCGVCTIVSLTLNQTLAGAFGHNDLAPVLWLVPAMAISMAIYLLLSQLALRAMQFQMIATRNATQAITSVAFQLIFGKVGFSATGLPLGTAGGQAVGTLSMVGILRSDWSTLKRAARPRLLMALAHRYQRFPRYLTLSGLLNNMGLQLPVLLIAGSYSASVTGWLGMAQRVLAVPVMLIGTAMAQVFLANASKAVREQQPSLVLEIKSTTRRLLLLSVLVAIPILVAGPRAFELVLGTQWRTSGVYAQGLVFGLLAQLVVSPVSGTLSVLERQGAQLAWDTFRLATVSASVAVGVRIGLSAQQVMWIFGSTLAITYAALLIMCLKAASSYDRSTTFGTMVR